MLDVLVQALAHLDPERADLYAELVLDALPRAAHDHLEALMTAETFEYQSRYARKLLAQVQTQTEGEAIGEARGEARGEAIGEARGRAADVLMVLDARAIDTPDDVRDRVTACTDLDQLDRWLRRAVTAGTARDLFE